MTARALVAIPSAAQRAVRQALGPCEAQFAATYPDAAVELTRRHYSLIFVGLHFGESRMFDFIELVREMQPSARIVALTSERDLESIARIRDECERSRQERQAGRP